MASLPIPTPEQPHCQHLISHSTKAAVLESHRRNLAYCEATENDIQLTNLRGTRSYEQSQGFFSRFTLTWVNWAGYRVYMMHCGCLVGAESQWLEQQVSSGNSGHAGTRVTLEPPIMDGTSGISGSVGSVAGSSCDGAAVGSNPTAPADGVYVAPPGSGYNGAIELPLFGPGGGGGGGSDGATPGSPHLRGYDISPEDTDTARIVISQGSVWRGGPTPPPGGDGNTQPPDQPPVPPPERLDHPTLGDL